MQGLFVADPVVRMRAADALEKISAPRPELLQSHKRLIVKKIAATGQQEVQQTR